MTKNLICRRLSEKEIIEIYKTIAVHHFPKAELKPVENVCRYLDQKLYMGYGLFCEDTLFAYALFLVVPTEKKLLLDYYAVLEEHRNTGTGSEFLQKLRKELTFAQGIYIESENPDYAKNEQEKTIRTKRIAFYHRNGAVSTGLCSILFEVPYQILYLPTNDTATADTANYFEDVDLIYHTMFPPDVYREKVQLFP